jgi:hypothetical protein
LSSLSLQYAQNPSNSFFPPMTYFSKYGPMNKKTVAILRTHATQMGKGTHIYMPLLVNQAILQDSKEKKNMCV